MAGAAGLGVARLDFKVPHYPPRGGAESFLRRTASNNLIRFPVGEPILQAAGVAMADAKLSTKELTGLNDRLNGHLEIIGRCTAPSKKYGRLLLASPPESRYPYVYPRDSSCAVQLFRRLAGSRKDYECADRAFTLMESVARFMRDVQAEDGSWGQRYSLDGENKSIYKQEDNVAHGIALLCNYLLAAQRAKRSVEDAASFIEAIDRGLHYAGRNLYQRELNLFESTTSIHESAMEEGYTCWVNYSFLYAYSLADEVSRAIGGGQALCKSHMGFRKQFLHSVSELFLTGDGDRFVRRITPQGSPDLRPDFTLLSPFYYGFLHYAEAIDQSVRYLEKQLWDPELGMIMRYLPFNRDFATHVHAGNGPWLQYTAVLAQYHFWNGDTGRGDELLAMIDSYRNEKGEIPEHLSTCARFELFLENEWKSGMDFAKEFDKSILLDDVDFDEILEEANNMARSYRETGSQCMIRDDAAAEGGYIQFASPLMWSHAEYARALLVRAGDWWKLESRSGS